MTYPDHPDQYDAYEFEELALYNREVALGYLHTTDFKWRMAIEQWRFHVEQRERWLDQGYTPHLLADGSTVCAPPTPAS